MDLGQVAIGVLLELEAMVGAINRGFQIPKDGVDPMKTSHLGAFASRPDDLGLVGTTGARHATEAGKTVGDHRRHGMQGAFRPLFYLVATECFDRREQNPQGMAFFAGFNRCDERDLVFRSASDLTPRAFAAEVRIVDFDSLGQDGGLLALAHRLHELMLEPPGGAIGDAEQAHEFQCRGAVLALGQKIDGLKPCGQRQFAAVKDGAGGQRHLAVAAITLERLDPAMPDHAVAGAVAVRTGEPLRPAGFLQHRLALRIGSVGVQKLSQTQSSLKLNAIHGHGNLLWVGIHGHSALRLRRNTSQAEDWY